MLAIYKKGSIAFTPMMNEKGGHRICTGLLLSMCPAKAGSTEGKRGTDIDLDKAITLSFDMLGSCRLKAWITVMLKGGNEELKEFRDYAGNTKTLMCRKGSEGTYGFTLSLSKGGSTDKPDSRNLFLSTSEMYALGMYVDAVIAKMLEAEFLEYSSPSE